MQFICKNSWNINYTLEVLRIIYQEQVFFLPLDNVHCVQLLG